MLHPKHVCVISLLALAVAGTIEARNTLSRFPLADALGTTAAKSRLDPDVKLYFGNQPHATPIKTLGTAKTNKKTNFFNKSDKAGCEWAFLSAMLQLQQRAKTDGGNAVINIKSITNTEELVSETEYLCRAGAVTGGVVFVGEVVKL